MLITGASGAGKSSLALALMGFGAALVSDDRTQLIGDAGGVWASAPQTISGMIEARGFGILNALPCAKARVALIVDLDLLETERLPEHKARMLLGHEIPHVHKVDSPAFSAAILQYLKAGMRGSS